VAAFIAGGLVLLLATLAPAAPTWKGGDRMSNSKEPSAAQKTIGDFAPKLVQLTDDVLFADVWERKELSPRDRSLITVASLITSGSTEQLVFHLNKAKENGLSEEELIEVITHLAFYAGWPKAMSAIMVAKEVFSKGK
jgi:4-carboxymuconolactone decarboxylase